MNAKSLRYVAAVALFTVAAAFYLRLATPVSAADTPVQRIVIEARKFTFSAREIHVRKGQRVTIVLTSQDFVHGFSVPDFNVRADAVPGKPVEVTFVADKAGKFIYLCDNFCGEDHDKMMGFLIVSES